MYSAKKVNGRRLYQLARKNITVPRDPVKIYLSKIDLLEYRGDEVKFSVTCSKGTYVRVLGSDIAKKAGTVGYLISLRRVSIGNYEIKDSIDIDSSLQVMEIIHSLDGFKALNSSVVTIGSYDGLHLKYHRDNICTYFQE